MVSTEPPAMGAAKHSSTTYRCIISCLHPLQAVWGCRGDGRGSVVEAGGGNARDAIASKVRHLLNLGASKGRGTPGVHITKHNLYITRFVQGRLCSCNRLCISVAIGMRCHG